MRRFIAAGAAALILLCSIGLSGCGPDKRTVVPEKEIELPKEGPSPVGGTPRVDSNPAGKEKPSPALQ
jgi:hypothetical protein